MFESKGSLVWRVTGPKVTERKYFYGQDQGAFLFIKAELKLWRKVRHLRRDSEKAVLVKQHLLWTKETDGQTPLEEELKLQKFHGILCPEGERELRSDLYGVWTGIPSSTRESRGPSPEWI